MKHSQKMILIPENNLDNYLRQQRLTTPPTVAKMAQLDGEMKTVLDRNDTSQDEKAKLYSKILENYLHFKGKRNVEAVCCSCHRLWARCALLFSKSPSLLSALSILMYGTNAIEQDPHNLAYLCKASPQTLKNERSWPTNFINNYSRSLLFRFAC